MSRIQACAFVLAGLAGMLSGQWLDYRTPGIPRTPDGKPDLSAPVPRASDGKPDLTGLWRTAQGPFTTNMAAGMKPEEIRPWAAAAHARNKDTMGAGFMSVTCMPFGPMATVRTEGGAARIIQTPGMVAILYADLTYRQIFLDGRGLPIDPNPAWMGYSVGHWDGDTLVAESTGFNDRTWLDFEGHPHTEKLHIVERMHRRDLGHIDLEVTFSDPEAYVEPWTVKTVMDGNFDTEMMEYVCNENEKDSKHLVGKLSDNKTVEVPVAVLARYVGTYEASRGPGNTRNITISLSGNQLLVTNNGIQSPLIPLSESLFVSGTGGGTFRFSEDVDGSMTFVTSAVEGDTRGVRKK